VTLEDRGVTREFRFEIWADAFRPGAEGRDASFVGSIDLGDVLEP